MGMILGKPDIRSTKHALQNTCFLGSGQNFCDLLGYSWLISIALWLSWIFMRLFMSRSIQPLDALVFPAVLVCAITFGTWLRKRAIGWRAVWVYAAAALALSFIFGLGTLLFASACYDVGWDGQYAHQSFIFFLAHGWNPLHEPIRVIAPSFASTHSWLAMGYFDGSLRGMGALLSASLVSLTGFQEAGKAINFWFLLPAFLFAYTGLIRWGLGRTLSLLIALAAALNPVALPLLLTYSLDAQLCALVTCLWGLSLNLWQRLTWMHSISFILSVLLLAFCKISGVGLAFILGGGLASLIGLRHFRKYFKNGKVLLGIGIASLVAALFLFWTIDNLDLLRTRERSGTKLERYEAVFRKYLDPSFNLRVAPFLKEYNPLTRLAISLFSQTNHGNRGVLLKCPFAIHKREAVIYLKLYEAPEIGGFGPWMGGACLLALGVLLFLVNHHHRIERASRAFWIVLIALIFISAAFLPMWLARYVPQLWLIPVSLAAMSSLYLDRGIGRWLMRMLIAALLGNILIILVLQTFSQWHVQCAMRRQLEQIAQLPQPIEIETKGGEYAPIELRLKEYGIRYHVFSSYSEEPGPRIHFLRTEEPRGPSVRVDLSDPKSREIFGALTELQEKLRAKWIMLNLVQ